MGCFSLLGVREVPERPGKSLHLDRLVPRMEALGEEPLRGQASLQWPSCQHSGQGFVSGRGWGHWRAQCPSLLHLKQAPGGAFFSLDLGFAPMPVFATSHRATSMAWVCRATFCCRCSWWATSASASRLLKTLNAIFTRSWMGLWGPSSAFLNFLLMSEAD